MILLEVIIALIFIYATASLFCSFVLEAIAARTGARAQMLRTSVTAMLGEEHTQKLYAHPRISAMFERHDRPPSYVPAPVFARVVLDNFRSPAGWLEPMSSEDVKHGIMKITHLPLRDNLASLYTASGEDIDEFEKQIGQWFDRVTERMTGWYKRRSQVLLVGIALICSVTFNLDTFTMVRTLWTNTVLRATLVSQAELLAVQPADQRDIGQLKQALAELPFGWVRQPAGYPNKNSQEKNGDAASANGNESIRAENHSGTDGQAIDGASVNWLFRVFGWLISALAIGLGATFWFDLLKKIVNIRATGLRFGQDRESQSP
jgi:hypothetical protein